MKYAIYYVDNLGQIYDEEISGKKHITYSNGGCIKTIRYKDAIFKDASQFGGSKEAYECLYIWKQMKLKGSPSSPSAFFREYCTAKPNIRASTNNCISYNFHGGWIRNLQNGFSHGQVYLYDIIQAYYWAGSLCLPMRVKFFKGNPSHHNFIARIRIKKSNINYPDFLQQEVAIITSEDLETYKDLEFNYIYGFHLYDFSYNPTVDVDYFHFLPNSAFKRLTQSYWGLWAMDSPIHCCSVNEHGEVKEWILYNRHKKLIWSYFIIHRVIQKVFESLTQSAINIYVDSILTKDQIKTGTEPGQWKLKETYNGVVIHAPGVWTDIKGFLQNKNRYKDWKKHSGYN